MLCYTPFMMSEVTFLFKHIKKWHKVLTKVTCSSQIRFCLFSSADPVRQNGPVTCSNMVEDPCISDVVPRLWFEPSHLLLPSGFPGGIPGPTVDQQQRLFRTSAYLYHSTRTLSRRFSVQKCKVSSKVSSIQSLYCNAKTFGKTMQQCLT